MSTGHPLQANLAGLPCTVYRSRSRDFTYWDESKNGGSYPFSSTQHTEKLSMGIDDFAARVRERAASVGAPRHYHYLQTSLVDGVASPCGRGPAETCDISRRASTAPRFFTDRATVT